MADECPKNGGPAFPLQSIGPDFAPGYGGMTLRDYFAGQALAGVMNRMHEDIQHLGSTTFPSNVACHAYRLADAMLKERSK